MNSRNCLSNWYPRIRDAGLPVPKTVIVTAPDGGRNLAMLLDGQTPPGWDAFVAALQARGNLVGWPCFLRTGHTSGKHNWKDTCYLAGPESVASHVLNLVEFSEMAGLIGLPCDVWAVRELLPTRPAFRCTAYGGMPVVREFRCFVAADGASQCLHPYWPVEAAERGRPDADNWRELLAATHQLTDEEGRIVRRLAKEAAEACPGDDWCVDLLDTQRGWYVTDMAIAADAWHWPDCAYNKAV